MGFLVLRVKNNIALKSRLLNSILNVNPSYSVKEYREEPYPDDETYSIISFTSYEKSPYCPVTKILEEFLRNNEVEYLNDPASNRVNDS